MHLFMFGDFIRSSFYLFIYLLQIQVPPVHSKPAKYSIEMYFYVRFFKAWSMNTKSLFVMGQTKTRTCNP